MVKELIYGKMEIDIQVTGKMVLEQEKVLSLGQMEPNMKVITSMGK